MFQQRRVVSTRAVRRLALCASIMTSLAWGQSNDPEAEKKPAHSEPQKSSLMEVVTVKGYQVSAATSATGIVTDLIDTPISISAVTSDFLKDTGSSQIMDAIGSLTGVTGQSNSGETLGNFSVRGYAVAPQIDGFDSLSVASGIGSSVGIDRIEVLKGPSAVFNGNVPPGGSINIIYKKPSFAPQTYFQGTVGSWNYRSGEFFSTGSLGTDKLAYFVDLYDKKSHGWVDWTAQNEKTVILGLTFQPIDAFTWTVNYRDIDNRNKISTLPVSHEGYMGSDAGQYSYVDAWVAEKFGPNEPPQTITTEQYLPGGKRYNVLGPQNHNNAELKWWSNEMSLKINDHWEIRDNFAYSKYEWDVLAVLQSGAKILAPNGTAGLFSQFFGVDIKGKAWQNKLESALYFDTGPISHSMLIGYQDGRARTGLLDLWIGSPQVNSSGNPWNFFTDGPILLQNEFNARLAVNPAPDAHITNSGLMRTQAYYIAEQMSMLDGRLHVLLGGRHTKTVADNLSVSDTTPQVGVLIKPFSEDSLFKDTAFFANYSKSFTPSGLVQPGTTQVVPPAQGVGREIGVKTGWFDGKLTSTVSLFRDDLTNIATPDYSHQGQNGDLVRYNLGGVGRAQGLEAEVVWTPTKNLQVSANYTNLPMAKYTAFPGVPQQIGLRFPSTPKRAANLSAKYTFDEGSLAGLYVGGWLHEQSETRGVMAADWHYDVHIPELLQLEAFAGYKYKNFDIVFNIRNLTNRGGYVMNNAFQPNPPRSYLLTLKYTL